MAWLEDRQGRYRIVFRFAGQRFARALKCREPRQANAALARLEDNLHRLELGTLVLPDRADIASFLLSDGALAARPTLPKLRTIGQLFEAYFSHLPEGALETSTQHCLRIHERHFRKSLGARTPLCEIGLSQLQGYIEARTRARTRRGEPIAPVTIKKELSSLRLVWNWAHDAELLDRGFPVRRLRFPKTEQKPPFRTLAEVQRRVARGGLTSAEERALWQSVFLSLEEIEALLQHVQQVDVPPFVYPMFVFAAHTGARRSEMLRSELDDLEFQTSSVLVRERKRVRGQASTRRVPMTKCLQRVLREWLIVHPGGRYTFALDERPAHSRKKVEGIAQLSPREAHFYFHAALSGTPWQALRGWHVFRHSFCSDCAAQGVDQRLINAWVGHQTEEMVQRYRHLLPSQERAAIDAVFG